MYVVLSSFPVIITGRNEVVAKVMFLHVCVILFTGGVSGQGDPPRQGEPPPPPPDQADTPPDQADTPPRTRQTPPPRKQTPEYGLRAAGTHPTGMHSCFEYIAEFYDLFSYLFLAR